MLEKCRKKRWLLPAVCYVAALVLTAAFGAVTLLRDTRGRAAGSLVPAALSLADFEAVNAEQKGSEVLVSAGDDPQLLYTAPAGQTLRTLTVAMTCDRFPYEQCVYYVTRAGQPFSQGRRVFATELSDGRLRFELPLGVTGIRFDPGSRADLTMTFASITVNDPRSATDYFLPDGGGWFLLAVVPALAAAALQCLADALETKEGAKRSRPWPHRRAQKKKGETDA